MYNKRVSPNGVLKKKRKDAGSFVSWDFFFVCFQIRIIVCSMVLEAYSYNQSLGTGNSC